MSIASDHVAIFQTHWAGRLVDTCEIVRRSPGAFNTTTGVYSPTDSTVYDGPCLVRSHGPASVLAGEELIEQRNYLVVVPFDEDDVAIDDVVVVASTFDGVLDGKELVVRNVAADTYNTSRKLVCEDNQGASGPV